MSSAASNTLALPRQGIVLLAHGSRDTAWRAPIETLAQRARTLAPEARIICAYLSLTEPSLPQAVQSLQAQGVTHIAVWPMFLGMGRHARDDLPQLLQTLRTQHPATHFTLHPAIAEHPGVQHAMVQAVLGK
ncbi:MAG: CbiX/SirB N-terminal domain-containing protein [Pseudomonadota bacterium]|nr:CbiX/SirB N-terminal domain-containing protein [Pseudomonadota bacterium]